MGRLCKFYSIKRGIFKKYYELAIVRHLVRERLTRILIGKLFFESTVRMYWVPNLERRKYRWYCNGFQKQYRVENGLDRAPGTWNDRMLIPERGSFREAEVSEVYLRREEFCLPVTVKGFHHLLIGFLVTSVRKQTRCGVPTTLQS